MSYKHTWEPSGVYRKYTGFITGQEVLQATEEVEGDARFDHIRYIINDFLDVDRYQIEERDVALLAAIDNVAAMSNPRIKIAIASADDNLQALVNLYNSYRLESPHITRIFASLDPAREWAQNTYVNWYERQLEVNGHNRYFT